MTWRIAGTASITVSSKLQRLVRLAPRLHLLGDVGIGRDEAAIGHRLAAQQDDRAAGRLDLKRERLARREAFAHPPGQARRFGLREAAALDP